MPVSKPENVENDDALDLGQVDDLAVDLEPNLPMEVLAGFSANHLAQAHLHVDALVVQPAVELVRVLLARVVEVQAEGRVKPDTEVVVHHEYLRIVFACRTSDYTIKHLL